MRLPKIREVVEAVKALVVGPYTSRFPKEMPEVPEAFRGAPRYHEDDCIGCAACYYACPGRAIDLDDDAETGRRILTIRHDRCLFCRQCELHCPTENKGVRLSKEWNLVTRDRSTVRESIEHELVVCEDCGKVIAPRKQILWIAERLGHLAYANPTLMLAAVQDRKLPVAEPVETEQPLRRGDRIRISCPECRRKVVLVV